MVVLQVGWACRLLQRCGLSGGCMEVNGSGLCNPLWGSQGGRVRAVRCLLVPSQWVLLPTPGFPLHCPRLDGLQACRSAEWVPTLHCRPCTGTLQRGVGLRLHGLAVKDHIPTWTIPILLDFAASRPYPSG